MSTSDFPSAASDEEAALWAARAEGGKLSREDNAALRVWLAADPEHPQLLERYRQLGDAFAEQLPALAQAGAFAAPAPAADSHARSPRFSRGLGFGLGLAAAAAVIVAGGLALSHRATQESFATASAQLRTVDLSDGSRVELSAHTTLTLVSTGRVRRAELRGGEAYFMVAKDPARPFIVDTPAGTVRVTGTVFDVRDEDREQLEVTVVEGSVQVSPSPGKSTFTLGRGDRFTSDHPGVQKISASDIDNVLAWRDGAHFFDETSLKDAMHIFSRYSGRPVVVAPEVAALTIGGRYPLDNRLLAGLEQALPVQISRDAAGVIHVDSRPRR